MQSTFCWLVTCNCDLVLFLTSDHPVTILMYFNDANQK